MAILNDRKTGETIFAIGYVPWMKRFDEEEFKAIVQSITFEKNPPKNFWGDFPKSQRGITTETESRWGPLKFKSKHEENL